MLLEVHLRAKVCLVKTVLIYKSRKGLPPQTSLTLNFVSPTDSLLPHPPSLFPSFSIHPSFSSLRPYFRILTTTAPGWTTASGAETTAISSSSCCRWAPTWWASSPSACSSCSTIWRGWEPCTPLWRILFLRGWGWNVECCVNGGKEQSWVLRKICHSFDTGLGRKLVESWWFGCWVLQECVSCWRGQLQFWLYVCVSNPVRGCKTVYL